MTVLRFVSAVLAIALLAGCAAEPSESTPETGNPTPEPQEWVLLDFNWTYVNDGPTPFATDRDITKFDVPDGVLSMRVVMARYEAPPEFFAANGRVYGPDDEFDQAAFNAGSAPEGELELTFTEPPGGEWRLAYVTDGAFPQGRHAVHVQVRILA